MNNVNRTVATRLVVSAVMVVVSLILSAVSFYYLHAKAPIIPLAIGLTGALPAGIIVDDLRRLLKVKKSEQPHNPPNRS